MKHIFLTVTNDLTYDQRMNRICTSLAAAGYKVTLIGRKRKSSQPLQERPFEQKRLPCWFDKGKFFYLEYNFRLTWFLLFHRFDIACAIDLDTILPCWIAARIKRKPLVYDAHEYFTEMEEIVSRPMIKKAWVGVEKFAVPKVDRAYTVSDGYARMFRDQYGTDFKVVRNATVLQELPPPNGMGQYILYQGAVNVGRGLEQLVEAMQYVDFPLYICGKGDVFDTLQQRVQELGLTSKVQFKGYIEPHKLRQYTLNARIGITLFSSKGLHHQYSLANRFFDYMHAAVPQVATNFPEYAHFNNQFEVAELVEDLDPKQIAAAINRLLNDPERYKHLQEQCRQAREHFNWQEEEKTLLSVYRELT